LIIANSSAAEQLLIKLSSQSSTTGVYCTADPLSLASDACAAATVRLSDFTLYIASEADSIVFSVNRDDFISKYRMTNLTKEQIAASTVTG